MNRTEGDQFAGRLRGFQKLCAQCAAAGEPKLLDVIEHGEIGSGWHESRTLRIVGDPWRWVVVAAAPVEHAGSAFINIMVGCYTMGTLEQLLWGKLLVEIPPRQNYDLFASHDRWPEGLILPAGEFRLFGWELPWR